MQTPSPPPRQAHLFDHEQGESLGDAQLGLLHRLASLADGGIDFHGDCTGNLQTAALQDRSAQLAFTSDRGGGLISLTIADNGWLRAEVFVADALVLRAWVEQAYEEKEFWPDGADGAGDAPGRISKRGGWLTIDCARFPGVPANEHGHWTVEERG
jgi:hypothetical protein